MANGGVVSNYPFKIKALASFLSWAIVVFGGAATSFAAEITAVRFGVTSPTETRIVLDSNGLLSYSLDADEAGQGQLPHIPLGRRLWRRLRHLRPWARSCGRLCGVGDGR